VGDLSAVPTAAAPILFADGVVRRFGRDEVLRGASLSLARGELVALVGRSGSGKSTLLSVLGGLDREYSGQVRVFDQELSTLSDAQISQLRNERIGFVFQSFHLLDHLTALENVLLPNTFAATPLSPALASERAREALSRVDLADRASALPPTLSGGQKQRVALARALFFRPQLLLCDEPTGNLDVDTGQKIIELFRTLNQREGLTLLLVTHEPRVAAVASRVLRIEAGQVIEAAHRELAPAAGDAAPSATPTAGSPEPARDRP
jgi:ABC-type lipoprotein export system ATPase subunit